MRRTMIRPTKQQPIKTSLTVPDYYATLLEEQTNGYVVNVFCHVLKHDIIKNNFSTLNVKVYEKKFPKIIGRSKNPAFKDSKIFRESIEKSNSMIMETSINLRKYDLELKSEFSKSLSESTPPIFVSLLQDAKINDSNLSLQDCNIEIIKGLKVDPSEALLDYNRYKNYSFVNKLKNHYLLNSIKNDGNVKYYRSIDTNVVKNRIYINFPLNISKNYTNSELEVVFELQKSKSATQLVVNSEKLTKLLKVSTLLSLKNLSLKKPSLELGYDGLHLYQNDEKAQAFKLQKKSINKSFVISNYQTITEDNGTKKDFLISVKQADSISELQIYRCLAFNSDTNNHTFCSYKNLIFGTTFDIDSTVLLIQESKENNGVEIIVQNVPNKASEFKIFKKRYIPDCFGAQEEEISISRYQSTKPVPNVVIDTNITSGDTCEYFVRYKMNDGTIQTSVSKIYQFIDTSKNKPISVQILSTTIDEYQSKPSVTITLDPRVVDEETNIIQQALQNSNFYEEYKDTFQKQLDKIQDLIFFKVVRTNLSKSPAIQEEFLDILTRSTLTFIDNLNSQKNSGVSELNLQDSYMYEFKAYYKNPLSLLKEYVIETPTKITTANKTLLKGYRYKPHKWSQKRVLNTGTILVEDEKGDLKSSTLDEHEYTGTVAKTYVQKLGKEVGINKCTAKRVDKNHVLINWQIISSQDEYDHFIIVKESNGQRKLLDATCNTQYLDSVDLTDAGTIIYYVIPVYMDYAVGNAKASNHIVLDPDEI